jgi:hypothetical protein
MADGPQNYPMESGYKILSHRRVKKRTRTRTSGTRRRGREKGSKNKSTIQRELLAKRELLAEGLLATEIMDQEIARLGELMALLRPWDEDGKQITGKSVNAYYWASELRRDYLHMRAPFQSPRLSAVQVMPAQAAKRTTVNVTILNERGEKVFSDVPEEKEDMKLIEGSLGEPG